MSKHLFRLLFGVLFLAGATAFTGCGDDDNKNSAEPKLTVSSESLNFTDETETTQTVDISANCEWKVVKTSLDWATVEPMTGKGNTKLSVSVGELPAGTTSREGKISFTLVHPEFGNWGEAQQAITVKQVAGGDIPVGEAIYTNDFDKERATQTHGTDNKYWPYLDQSDCWENAKGTGIETMTHEFKSMSARANQFSDSQYSDEDYKGLASGVNNLMAGSGGYFVIKDITLPVGKTNYELTFGVMGEYQKDFDPSMLKLELSADGTNWVPITYTRSTTQNWGLAKSDFTLAAAAEKISIRFTPVQNGRIDDVKFAEGVGGQNVDLNSAPEPSKTTIGNITKAGTYETEGTVVARGKMAYIIADNTGAMMVYHKDNERTVGDKITIKGEVTIFNASATPQFSAAAAVEVVSTGNAWTYNPTEMDAAAMDALVTASPVCKEIQFEGLLEISGNYANVTIDGASTAIGSIKYIDNSTLSALDGKNIVIKGYFVGTSSSKYINILPYSVKESGAPADPKISSVSPSSLLFSAAGESKDVTVTLNSAAQGLAIEASADNAQFTAAVNGTKVTVTAKENTTADAITGTLTVKLMKAGAAVDTKTVALSQAGKSTTPVGNGYVRVNAVTSGKKYLLVAQKDNKNYVFDASIIKSGKVNGTEVTVTGDKIESNATNNAFALTITANGNHYLLQTADGKYVEYSSASKPGTNLAVSDAQSDNRGWVFEPGDYPTTNTFLIKDISTLEASTKRALLFQTYAQSSGATKEFNRFGAYSAKNAAADFDRTKEEYLCIALYELSE